MSAILPSFGFLQEAQPLPLCKSSGSSSLVRPSHARRPSFWPAVADMLRQPEQISANLDAGRRLAGTQHDSDGPASVGVVDTDRQEAALVVMGVEQRELLIPMTAARHGSMLAA